MTQLQAERIKVDFREFCVKNLTLRTINDAFESAGISRGHYFNNADIGDRRKLVEEYYASLNWSTFDSDHRLLRVLENLLFYSSSLERLKKEKLCKICTLHNLLIQESTRRISLSTTENSQGFKNLIFAADGPKPEIVFTDLVDNKIKITRNAEFCLIYGDPINLEGLLWRELFEWWCKKESLPANPFQERSFYKRLSRSLQSQPEKLLFQLYFKCFHQQLKSQLPALIPQVYLHYAPYTKRDLKGRQRLLRQRIDFLLLLPQGRRVVIEVDGKQHYSKDEKPSPKLYAEMVSEDRQLKLSGYEVYRFGGYELRELDIETEVRVEDFFKQLFIRHEVVTD